MFGSMHSCVADEIVLILSDVRHIVDAVRELHYHVLHIAKTFETSAHVIFVVLAENVSQFSESPRSCPL